MKGLASWVSSGGKVPKGRPANDTSKDRTYVHAYKAPGGKWQAEEHPTKQSAHEAGKAARAAGADANAYKKSDYHKFGIDKQLGNPHVKGADEYNRDDHGRFSSK